MGSCMDLRSFQDVSAVQDAFGMLVSGKSGYKPIMERRIDPVKCPKCGTIVEGPKKFCPNCGEKVERKPTSTKCVKCGNLYEDNDVFCGECGSKRE